MNPRRVDFDFLDSVKVNLQEKLALLQLERFCSESTVAFSELTAYFYSNLSFFDVNSFSFTVKDKEFLVDMDTLADIIRVERMSFQPISVSIAHATLSLVKNRDVEGKISYSRMNASNILLHKIVINCIRPKSTSKIDVSRSEAKLMYAINAGFKFSMPHTILFHMYQIVVKDSDNSLIMLLSRVSLETLKIHIYVPLSLTTIPLMVIVLKWSQKCVRKS